MAARTTRLGIAQEGAPQRGFLSPPPSRICPTSFCAIPMLPPRPSAVRRRCRNFSCSPRAQFFLSIAHQPIGTVLLSSFASSDLTFLTEHVDGLHLVVCANGRRRVVTPAGAVECHGDGALLLPCGQRRAFGSHSAAIFSLPPAAIRAAGGSDGWRQRLRKSAELCAACHSTRPDRGGAAPAAALD